MKKKIFIISVLALVVLFILAGGALAAHKARPSTVKVIKATDVLSVDGGEPQPYFGPTPTPIMYEKAITACDTIHPDTAVAVIQLDQWGTTYYDYQKNGSMGRMIAVGPNGEREMVFMRTNGPFGAAFPRWVTYNCKDWSGSWCRGDSGFNVDGGANVNAGYVNIAAMHDGREAIIYHNTGSLKEWNTTLAVGDLNKVCSSQNIFFYKYDIPDSLGEGSTEQGMWPKVAVMYDDSVDTDYIHIVETEGKTLGGNLRLGYTRCHLIAGGNLLCETPTGQPDVTSPITVPPNVKLVPNKNVAYFGETSPGSGDYPNDISVVVVTSPVSRKVGIVFVNKKQAGSNQVDNDVFYFESTNNGDSWFPQYGGTWPPTIANGMLHNVTNYPALGSERAYMDLAACYDYNDNLHIVWPAIHYDPITQGAWVESKLYHWSQATGINFIVSGYNRPGVDPGRWNLTLSKPSVSAKDPIYHPPDSVYLFVTWTSFDTSDNALNDYTNGEIYATCSADSGRLWTKRYNLTGTKTAGCDSGNCLSEHWSSMAENMYNGDLHIEYVCDRDAGGYDGGGTDAEGKCTADPMMYMHVQQLPYKGFCEVGYTIMEPTDWTAPPIKVPIGGDRVFRFNILAAGNLPGYYQVSSDNGLVAITSGGDGYLEPGDTAIVEGLIFSPGEQFIKATITVSGCDGEVNYELPLYAVSSDTNYYECAADSSTFIQKNNGICSLYVCINSEQELWDKRWPEDSQKVMDAGGVIIATTSADGKKIVGRQEWTRVFTGARDTFKVIQDTSFAEPTCLIQRIYGSKTYIWTPEVIDAATSNIQWWWVEINQQIILFHDRPGYTCSEWKKEQIIKQVWINWGRPPVWWPGYPFALEAHRKMYFGYFADFDAPADQPLRRSANLAGFDPVRQIAWQHGWYNDTLPTGHPEYDGYYLGLALTNTAGGVVAPKGAQNVMNNVYVYPNEGWVDDSLYRLASTPGVWIQDPDSITDRVWVLTADTIKAGTLNDTTWKSEFIMIEALIKSDGTPAQGLTALQNHIDTTRAVLIPELDSLNVFEPTICGDVDCDGHVNVTDILYLIVYLFYTPQGPPPCPPWQRADVNGDYKIDVADVVYLCHYLYQPGAPSPNCPYLPGYIPPSWGNDPLNPDTVYVRVEDPKSTPEGTDIPVTIWLSNDEDLEAMVIPFCWSGDAYLDLAKNSTDPDSEYYIFRDYNGIPNRFRPYCDPDSDWDTRILGIGTSNLFLFVEGTCYWPGHPFHPGSGLFATFVFTCNQPTAPLIDTCFHPPSYHLLFVEPNNNYFTPRFRTWEPIDCNRSYTDTCLTFCPLGDIDFRVTLRDNKNKPVVGYSNVWLDFTDCVGEVIPCPSFHPQWPLVFPEGPSDGSGRVYFRVHAGGYSQNSVKVKAGCGQITEVFFPKSVDLSGNLLVEPSDFDVSYGNNRDFNCDDTVDWRDDDIFKRHKNHGCSFSPCLFLQQTITLNPDTTLVPGDSIDVTWRMENLNSFDTCYIEKVELYYTDFSGSVGLIKFHTEYWNSNLPPRGNIQLTVHNFITPDLPNMCVIARTYTDCCTLYTEAKNCWDIKRRCPPDSITYRWFMLDIGTPTQIDTTFRGAVPDKWPYSIQWGVSPDTDVIVEITTDDESPMGTEGGVTLWFKYDDIWEDKNFEVIFTLNSGDVNSDCIVNVTDVVYLINYKFIVPPGPPPDPLRAGDVNCDCVINVSDVVYLINYLFIGGPPPASSETCECGYKGWVSFPY